MLPLESYIVAGKRTPLTAISKRNGKTVTLSRASLSVASLRQLFRSARSANAWPTIGTRPRRSWELRECKRSRSWAFSFSNALNPILEMLTDTLAMNSPAIPAGFISPWRGLSETQSRVPYGTRKRKPLAAIAATHVKRDSARLRQASDDSGVANLPVAVVDARDRSGSHDALLLEARKSGDLADC